MTIREWWDRETLFFRPKAFACRQFGWEGLIGMAERNYRDARVLSFCSVLALFINLFLVHSARTVLLLGADVACTVVNLAVFIRGLEAVRRTRSFLTYLKFNRVIANLDKGSANDPFAGR